MKRGLCFVGLVELSPVCVWSEPALLATAPASDGDQAAAERGDGAGGGDHHEGYPTISVPVPIGVDLVVAAG